MSSIKYLIDNNIISETYSTPEFEKFMKICKKIFPGYGYKNILITLEMYNDECLNGTFDNENPLELLRDIFIEGIPFYLDKLTNSRLDNYSFLDCISKNVKKSVYLLVCIGNGTIQINYDNIRLERQYFNYLKSLNDIEEFVDFMDNIPEELKCSGIKQDIDYFESLFENEFSN